MKLKSQLFSIDVLTLTLTLNEPFTTSFGTEYYNKRVFILLMTHVGSMGLGEIPSMNSPAYKPECDFYSILTSLEKFIIPSIKKYQKKKGNINTLDKLVESYSWIKGAYFAKSGLDAAFWHLLSNENKRPLHKVFGGTRTKIVSGVSIGGKTKSEVLEKAKIAIEKGYPRLKIKIWPGFDIEVVKALRKKHPDILLQVDANSAYDKKDYKLLKKLDAYNLLLIEQPLAENDIVNHSEISKKIKTPICLDESIHSSEDVESAILLWKKNKILNRLIINIKPPRVGGYTEAIKIAKLCGENKIDCWCGGMLDSGWGKYMNMCFNSRKELTLPGDHFSPTGNYFKNDILSENLTAKKGIFKLDKPPTIDWKSLDKLTKTKKTYKLC
ncbi:MAG: o-succinylbenzoate synthase [Candidatus Woesebacteria bacterium]|jgi:O-succinylbenzoate synthase